MALSGDALKRDEDESDNYITLLKNPKHLEQLNNLTIKKHSIKTCFTLYRFIPRLVIVKQSFTYFVTLWETFVTEEGENSNT